MLFELATTTAFDCGVKRRFPSLEFSKSAEPNRRCRLRSKEIFGVRGGLAKLDEVKLLLTAVLVDAVDDDCAEGEIKLDGLFSDILTNDLSSFELL